MGSRPLAVARALAGVVVVASLVALAVFASLHGTETRTRTITRRLPAGSAAGLHGTNPNPATAPTATRRSALGSSDRSAGVVVTGAPATSPPSAVPATASAQASAERLPGPAPGSATGNPPAPTSPASHASTPRCPLGLPAPAQPGGLASLIGLTPLFGPFGSEAFAMAPAYAPVLALVGPSIVQLVAAYDHIEPALGPLLSTWEKLMGTGFRVLDPLYGTRRQAVLGYETRLASILAPYTTALAGSPAGACLVDLQGMLVSAAHGS